VGDLQDKAKSEAELQKALQGVQLALIPAGVPRKPGMTRDDLFNTNAGVVCPAHPACASPVALLRQSCGSASGSMNNVTLHWLCDSSLSMRRNARGGAQAVRASAISIAIRVAAQLGHFTSTSLCCLRGNRHRAGPGGGHRQGGARRLGGHHQQPRQLNGAHCRRGLQARGWAAKTLTLPAALLLTRCTAV
jgi:lactate/malate dehydrogenase, NAD binding domain